MRQFDLVDNPSTKSRAAAPYFVILQSHHIELDTVVVAPLLRDVRRQFTGIDVQVTVGGEPLVLALTELFSIDRALLKSAGQNLLDHEDAIRRALERVFTGF